MTERLIIQRPLTGEVLSYDYREATHGAFDRQLSAVATMPLTVGAGQATRLAADGQPMFQEWATIVTLDDDGQIRFRGVVTKMNWDEQDWKITLSSLSTYVYGTPYEGDPWYGTQVDPTAVLTMLWAHAQSFPDSNVGITVTGSTSVRIGSTSTQRRQQAEAAYTAAVATYTAENRIAQNLKFTVAASRKQAADLRGDRAASSKHLTAAKTAYTAAKKTKDNAKIAAAKAALDAAQAAYDSATRDLNDVDGRVTLQQAAVDAQSKVVEASKAAKDKASDVVSAAKQAESDDGGAYAIEPWEAPDCGSTIDTLAKETPFDWVEEHYWNGDIPQTRIRVVHPRIGRRLDGDGDPTFVQGVNITVALTPETNGNDFANSAYGVGAGEGAGALRRSITIRNGRLRRVASFQAKDVKKADDLDRKLRTELTARQETPSVSQITVREHPNAKRGSYGLGDDIYVQGRVAHYGRFELWHRIVGITENTDGTTSLDLKRTDSFTYGAGVDA